MSLDRAFDPSAMSDRELLIIIYQEQRHARGEFDVLKKHVDTWQCPGKQCSEHARRMESMGSEIDTVTDCVETLKDHEKIIVGTVILVASVFGVFALDKLLGG